MFSKWQRRYEEEAERLVEVLGRWHALEQEAKRLEWELARCRKPEDDHPEAPAEARKPALLRRAEEGKSIVPDSKRGIEQSWKNRHKEVRTFREHYEVNTRRLTLQVERLAKRLDECAAAQSQGMGNGQKAAKSADAGGAKDPYERMPPALRRLRKQLEKARQEHAAPPPEAPAPETGVRTVEAAPRTREAAVLETDASEETAGVQTTPEKAVAPEKPQETPSPVRPPQEEEQRTEPSWEEQYRALEQEHRALAAAKAEAEAQAERATAQMRATEKEIATEREAVETAARKQDALRQEFEAFQSLVRHLRNGQRSFLGQPDAPPVGAELAGLIYYALTRLAAALAAGETVRARAMFANLYTIARNLQSYKLTTLHGFDAALDVLRTLPGGDAAQYAGRLTRSPQTPGLDAQPLRDALKTMRDKASVELRPFFYDIDAEGEVITLG
jgi:chromosome segregation ATPase